MRYIGKKVGLVIMFVLAVLIGAMSAYGAMCPLYNPADLLLPDVELGYVELGSYILYNAVTDYRIYYLVSNYATWAAAGLSIVCIVALFARWKVFYPLALFTVIVGAVSGLVPWLILYMLGGSTPSYMRAAIYGITLILLVIPPIFKPFLPKNIKETRRVEGSATPALAAGLFFPGVLLAIQALIVGPSHQMPGADLYMSYGMIEAFQVGLGILLVASSILIFAITRLRSRK